MANGTTLGLQKMGFASGLNLTSSWKSLRQPSSGLNRSGNSRQSCSTPSEGLNLASDRSNSGGTGLPIH